MSQAEVKFESMSAAPPAPAAPARSKLIALAAYPARQCAYRVFNEVTLAAPEWNPDPELRARLDGGVAFEAQVRAALATSHGDKFVDYSDADLAPGDLIEATVLAMNRGVSVVAGGRLPDDPAGRRTGKPDLLVRCEDRSDGRPGYRVGEIKGHTFLACGHGEWTGSLNAPRPSSMSYDSTTALKADREADVLQCAHYQRMLEACGFAAPGDRWTALVGTDTLGGDGTVGCVWVDLDFPRFRTYSASDPRGWKVRSAMVRYDHEFGFRLRVADAASGPESVALIEPIWQPECDRCPWIEVCTPALVRDPSYAVGRLDRREWTALRACGIASLDDLARLHTTAGGPGNWEHLADYRGKVSHRTQWRSRLAGAAHCAELTRRNVRVERTTRGPIAVQRADIEIDLDAEFDRDANYKDQVFLWGARRHDRRSGEITFRAFADWSDPTAGELTAATFSMWDWLDRQVVEAEATQRSLAVYHYHDPETRLLRAAAAAGRIDPVAVEAVIERCFVDLLTHVRANFFGVDGLGLKKIAAHAGFSWRDEDPGGLQCVQWFRASLSGDAAAEALRQRVIAYNADDLEATAVVRDWLTSAP